MKHDILKILRGNMSRISSETVKKLLDEIQEEHHCSIEEIAQQSKKLDPAGKGIHPSTLYALQNHPDRSAEQRTIRILLYAYPEYSLEKVGGKVQILKQSESEKLKADTSNDPEGQLFKLLNENTELKEALKQIIDAVAQGNILKITRKAAEIEQCFNFQ